MRPTPPVSPAGRLAEILDERLPEVVGVIVSVLVAVVVLALGPLSGRPGASPPPGTPGGLATPTPSIAATPAVDASLVTLMVSVNDQIAATGARLEILAATVPFPAADVAAAVRELNATARSALELVPQLERQPGALEIADRLSAFYDAIRTTATAGLQASVTNAPAYARTAASLAVILEGLPALQGDLQALLLFPPASAVPTPTAVPTPDESPTPTPDPNATPGPTPEPTPAPTPTPAGGPDLVANGAFDGGATSPWVLHLDTGVSGQLGIDTVRVASAPASGRVTVATPTTSRGAVALRQGGIPIVAGATYVMRVALSSAEPREVLLRVMSVDGVTYGARIVVATEAWAVYELEFSAPIGDPAALVSIELGRSTASTWIDDVSLREAVALPGS